MTPIKYCTKEACRVLFIVSILLFAVIILLASRSEALNNGLALTPPMGWLAWERYVCQTDCNQYPEECINEHLFISMAERLVSDGFKKVGYEYINIDDCWSKRKREDGTKKLSADPSRFTNGSIKPLARRVHELGLKLGLYGDCGTYTCQNFPGQLANNENLTDNYYDLDATTFAEWEIDSFKFDACYVNTKESHNLCPPMGLALNRTGRPMLFSCSWPAYENDEKLATNWTILVERCNLWRAFGDIEDSWTSVLGTIDSFIAKQNLILQYHGPGHWFDADQLVIGNFGLSLEQERAHMAIWCIWSSPLYMSNDLRQLSLDSSKILRNEYAIRVNQDRMGIFGLMLAELYGKQVQVFVKPIEPLDEDKCPMYAIVLLDRRTLGSSRFASVQLGPLLTSLHGNLTQLTPKWSHWSHCVSAHRANGSIRYQVHDLFDDNAIIQQNLRMSDGIIRLRVDPSGSRFIQLMRQQE